MKTEDAIKERQSIRNFSNKPVKIDPVVEAIDAAIHAPFAGNINNLKFIIVQTKEGKGVLSEFSQQFWINDSSYVLIMCSEPNKLEEPYQERGLIYNRQQAGAAVENILLRITDLGLGACWVGAFSEHEIKSHFRIPNEWQVEALIPIGYAKNKKRRPTKKANIETKIFWEKWAEKIKKRKYPGEDPERDYALPDYWNDEMKKK